jgi:DNA-binding NarL/FixJ family response regulator
MSTPLKTRILIADDHHVVRRGLSMVLDAAPDLEVVAEVGDGVEAVERALQDDIDLAILDVTMPRRTGLQAARELVRQRPQLRVLMLSMHDQEAYCFEALKAGASGYVLKTVADRELVEACRSAMRGEPFLTPPTIRTLLRSYLDDPGRHARTLSDREEEVTRHARPARADPLGDPARPGRALRPRIALSVTAPRPATPPRSRRA